MIRLFEISENWSGDHVVRLHEFADSRTMSGFIKGHHDRPSDGSDEHVIAAAWQRIHDSSGLGSTHFRATCKSHEDAVRLVYDSLEDPDSEIHDRERGAPSAETYLSSVRDGRRHLIPLEQLRQPPPGW